MFSVESLEICKYIRFLRLNYLGFLKFWILAHEFLMASSVSATCEGTKFFRPGKVRINSTNFWPARRLWKIRVTSWASNSYGTIKTMKIIRFSWQIGINQQFLGAIRQLKLTLTGTSAGILMTGMEIWSNKRTEGSKRFLRTSFTAAAVPSLSQLPVCVHWMSHIKWTH